MKQVGGSSVALAPGHPKIPLKRNPPANPTAPIPIIVTNPGLRRTQLHSGKLLAGLLPKSLSLSLIISVLLLATLWASAADPLGATPHSDGSTTFRVWTPFVDAVAVKINGGTPLPNFPYFTGLPINISNS
jgi:hypothetical protein